MDPGLTTLLARLLLYVNGLIVSLKAEKKPTLACRAVIRAREGESESSQLVLRG